MVVIIIVLTNNYFILGYFCVEITRFMFLKQHFISLFLSLLFVLSLNIIIFMISICRYIDAMGMRERERERERENKLYHEVAITFYNINCFDKKLHLLNYFCLETL